MDNPHIDEGFRGQVLHTLPRPLLARAARHLLGAPLYPTNVGWFPRARYHFKERPAGAPEHILIYCTAGHGWCALGGARHAIGPRQALLIPRGQPHAYGADTRRPWSIHWVHFSGEDAAVYAGLWPPGQPVHGVPAATGRRLVGLFRDCAGVFAGGITVPRILYSAHALRHLLGTLCFSARPGQRRRAGARPLAHPPFEEVIGFMQRHLRGRLRLRDLAWQAHLSVPRFAALFKAQTGVAPVEYYIRLRIQAACRLLDTTALHVNEVAQAVGYDDPYYFSRLFRKVMGLPPRAYRRAAQG